MMTIREYKRAESLEEAWQLNQKRNNRVIGGMIWLKMENINVGTAIDLSGLGLDKIEETAKGFSIGAMVPLRQIELHEGLNAYTDGAVRESVRHIVGVQLRNLATVGGSIYSRFGFRTCSPCSWPWTAPWSCTRAASYRCATMPSVLTTVTFSCA